MSTIRAYPMGIVANIFLQEQRPSFGTFNLRSNDVTSRHCLPRLLKQESERIQRDKACIR